MIRNLIDNSWEWYTTEYFMDTNNYDKIIKKALLQSIKLSSSSNKHLRLTVWKYTKEKIPQITFAIRS